jgi:P4 family phage/plasmid primase-like protien
MTHSALTSAKDVGWLVGGTFDPPTRRKDHLRYRDLVALDADNLCPEDVDLLRSVYKDLGLAFVLHSTFKHRPEKPRLRLVFPLIRSVDNAKEYEAISRRVASWSDIELFDNTTFEFSRVMFLPAHPYDVAPICEHHNGDWLDPDAVLSEYEEEVEDWQDDRCWARSTTDHSTFRERKKAADPYEKIAPIGAFNRAYSISAAILEFELPYKDCGDRWAYIYEDGVAPGLLINDEYGPESLCWSFHGTDPAYGQMLSAYDLVRIHKFGKMDSGFDGEWAHAPSQRAMENFALGLIDVQQELAAECDLTAETAGTNDAEVREVELSFDSLREEIASWEQSSNRTRDGAKGLLNKIATCRRLGDTDTNALLGDLHKAWKSLGENVGLTDLKADVKKLRRSFKKKAKSDSVLDIDELLVQAVLDRYYGGGDHIKRVKSRFWVYETGVWRLTDDEIVRSRVQSTFIQMRKAQSDQGGEALAALNETATSTAVARLWQMIVAHVAGLDAGKADPLRLEEPRGAVINCIDCELHFDDQGNIEKRPHDPLQFLTTQVPLAYDPDAKCPEWDRFCGLIFAHAKEPEEMQRHLEEICGYILQQDRDLKTWVLLRGASDAGKSTIGKVLLRLLRSAALSPQSMQEFAHDKHASADLVGKLLILDDDFRKGDTLDDGFIKQISEEKTIAARPMYGSRFQFLCLAVPMVCSNHWPRVSDQSDAMSRRTHVFDFPSPLPRSERSKLRAKRMLEDELPGVMARFVLAFQRLRKRGGYLIPAECLEARDCFLLHSDVARLWIRSRMVEDRGGFVKRSQAWSSFAYWSKHDERVIGGGLTQSEFYERLQTLLGKPTKRSEWGWKGWRFSDEEFS